MFRRAPAPFKLHETGPVETAVVWKNMIALMRNSIAWVVIFAAIMAFMLGIRSGRTRSRSTPPSA